jgi:hypothetical protein
MVLLRPGNTLVDVGSYIGFFILIASSLVGSKGHVYAFDANFGSFRKIKVKRGRISLDGSFIKGCLEQERYSVIFEPRTSGGNSLGKADSGLK